MEFPEDLRYTKEHEWARAEDGERPRRHHRLRAGCARRRGLRRPAGGGRRGDGEQAFGEVESTKSVSDVFSPLSGTIVERNPLLDERPELVNEQPYGDGWLIVIEVADPALVEHCWMPRRIRRSSSEGS